MTPLQLATWFGSFALVAWAAGALVQLVAELVLLRALPTPQSATLLHALLSAGARTVPLGLALALLALPLRRWGRTLSRRSGVVIALVLATAPAWMTALSRLAPAPAAPGRPLASADGTRVVLLGMDGADWSLVGDMIDAGELPTLTRLQHEGVFGPLRSLEPTLSNRVWTSAATGVVPERHGITDFFFDRRAIRVPTVWDLVDGAGGRVGLFEYLVTEPPMPVSGFVLPGWMAYRPTETHPPDLSKRLRYYAALSRPFDTVRYLLARNGDSRTGYRQTFEAGQVGTAFLALMDRYSPDVAACVWYATDRAGHRLWRYFEPHRFDEPMPTGGEAFGETLPNAYRLLDREIGDTIERLDDGRTLFIVMSDHGMGPMDSVEVSGYPRGTRALSLLHLEADFYVESPHSELFVNARVEGRSEPWTVSRDEHAAAVMEAVDRFRAVQHADGEPVFDVDVGDLSNVDVKVRVRNAAALREDMPVRVNGTRHRLRDIVQLVEVSGTHRIDGIAFLSGAGIRRGGTLDGAVITDIAPTILYALGLPVAEDLDGRVLTEAFTEAWLHRHPVRTVPTFGTNDIVAPANPPNEALIEKLRSLGYIR